MVAIYNSGNSRIGVFLFLSKKTIKQKEFILEKKITETSSGRFLFPVTLMGTALTKLVLFIPILTTLLLFLFSNPTNLTNLSVTTFRQPTIGTLLKLVLSLVILAAFIVYAYTPWLTRIWITELFPGIGFGPLLVIGAYITQLNPENLKISTAALLASVPTGILVSNLLWVNEIPDYEADLKTGRKHGVILLGKKGAAWGYVVMLVLAYVSIIIPVALKLLPTFTLLGLLTAPVAIKAGRGALSYYDQTKKLVPVLGQNIIVVLATPLLISVGFFLAAFLSNS